MIDIGWETRDNLARVDLGFAFRELGYPATKYILEFMFDAYKENKYGIRDLNEFVKTYSAFLIK